MEDLGVLPKRTKDQSTDHVTPLNLSAMVWMVRQGLFALGITGEQVD
jgi:hypothetical protein